MTIIKEEGSRKIQQENEYVNRCFEEQRVKEGKIGWRSPKNVGQVDLEF
jgi:hypothetical protein